MPEDATYYVGVTSLTLGDHTGATAIYNAGEFVKTAPLIPSSVTDMEATFYECANLTGDIEIKATPTSYIQCFSYTSKEINLSGSSTLLQELAATSSKGNVTVAE